MKKIKILFLSSALVIGAGCHDDFLEDKAYSVITEDNFFRTQADALTALNGVYNTLRDAGLYSGDLLALNEYPSETTTTRLPLGSAQSNQDLWNFEAGYFSGIYPASYRLIERANQVIANVPQIQMLPALQNRIIGEATFLRSLAYFNLVRVYGGVPLKLAPTTDFNTTSFPRASAHEVYDQILSDLNNVLSQDWLPKTSSYTGNNRGRAGRSAVQALLGKVYLTRATESFGTPQDYQSAIQVLHALVTEADRSLLPSYGNVFSIANENNAEIIFDVQNKRASNLGGNLTSFIATDVTNELYIKPPYYDYPATISFYTSFETGDTRRAATFHDRMQVPISGVNTQVYFDPTGDPNVAVWRRVDNNTLVPVAVVRAHVPGYRKFLDPDPAAAQNAEEPNYVILRYADVLLMLAEAINESTGPNGQALEYLNMVRRRAFGQSPTIASAFDYPAMDKTSFRTALFNERRKEFAMEWQGWFDGKRFWDLYTERVAISSIGANPGLNNRPKAVIDLGTLRQEKNKLMPFSISQLELNPGLGPNNPGY